VTPPEHRPTAHQKAKNGMAGELHKYSPAFFKSWQRRYCVLQDHQLKYFKKNDEGKWEQLAGVLNFDLYLCSAKCQGKDQFEILVHGLDRKFEFKCEKGEQMRDLWFAQVIKEIKESDGFIKQLAPPTAKEFWRTEQITEQQFLKLADTFDVLLCKCNHTGGKLTRFYTGSDFGKYTY
jgi:hypothetical protein